MKKILVYILPILFAGNLFAAQIPGSKWFTCKDEQDPDNYCQTVATYPDHATERKCNKSLNKCVAKVCDEANGWTLALSANGNSNGYCKRKTTSAQTQQPSQPIPEPVAQNISISGATVESRPNDSEKDHVVSGVKITIATSAECTSDTVTGEFDCGTVTNPNTEITFTKEGFTQKRVLASAFQNKFSPRVVLERDPSSPAPLVPANDVGGDNTTFVIDTTARAKSMCERSGGTMDDNGQCTCDSARFLEKTTIIDTNNNDTPVIICKCINGYRRTTTSQDENGNVTYIAEGECEDAGDFEEHDVPDLDAMSAAANAAYQDEYNNSQSLANRLLGGGSTLMTGEGAMAAASAYAEQRADKAAEQDMAAYLATFKCEYGKGKSFNGGNTEITLPGGNELTGYYTEYKQIADRVKEYKTALGLRPGIESEVLYEHAQTGLYQYENIGITGGAYTSLSRALQDSESKDATDWEQQKSDTAEKLKKGLIAAASGVIAGVAGNYFINGKRQRQELKDEFTKVQTRLENEYPEVFTPDGVPTQPEAEYDVPDLPVVMPITTDKIDGYNRNIYETAFEYAKFTLSPEGERGLEAYIKEINSVLAQPNHAQSRIRISTNGHTDKVPVRRGNPNYKDNTDLSIQRANAVLTYLQNNFNNPKVTFGTATGDGEQWCNEHPNATDAECRHVEINLEDITPGTQYI